jgi:hypothetical protein
MTTLSIWELQWGRSSVEYANVAASNFKEALALSVSYIQQQKQHWVDVGENDIQGLKRRNESVVVANP